MTQYRKDKLYWTPSEVCKFIFSDEISKTTILNLIHQGKIPAIRLASRWYIPKWWVERKIELAVNERSDNHEKCCDA